MKRKQYLEGSVTEASREISDTSAATGSCPNTRCTPLWNLKLAPAAPTRPNIVHKRYLFKQPVPAEDSLFLQKLPQSERSAYFHHYTSGNLDAAITEQTWHFLIKLKFGLNSNFNATQRRLQKAPVPKCQAWRKKHLNTHGSCQTSTKPNHLGELHTQEVKLMTWKTSCN